MADSRTIEIRITAKNLADPEVAKALAQLKGVTDGTVKVKQATEESTGSLTKNVASYAAGLATWEGAKRLWSGLTSFVGSSIAAFAEQESAQVKLTAALRNQSLAIPSVIREYTAMASAMQRMSVFGDEAVLGVQAMLIQVGGVMPSQMQRATQATLDLAAGLGMDLNAAGMLVAKAMSGNTDTLGRYGITLNKARIEAEGTSYVLGELNKRFGGQAEAQLETYAGRTAQLSNAWGDFKEQVGAFIVTNPLVIKHLNDAADSATEASGSVDGMSLSWASFFVNAAGSNTVLVDLIRSMENSADAANEARSMLRQATAGLQEYRGSIQDASGAQDVAARGLAVFNSAQEQFEARVRSAKTATAGLTTEQKSQIRTLLDLGDSVGGVSSTLNLSERAVKAYADQVKASEQAQKKAAEKAKALAEQMVKLDDALYKTAQEGMAAVIKGAREADTSFDDLLQTTIDLTAALPRAKQVSAGLGSELLKMGEQGAQTGVKIEDASGRIASGISRAADVIENLSRVAEMSGHKTTAALLSVASSTAKAFATGGPFAAAMTAAMGLITTFANKLFKLEGKKVNDLRDDFIAAAGGLHALNVKAHEAGMTLDALLRASTVKDYEAAVKSLTDAFAAQNAKLEEQKRLQGEIAGVEGQLAALRASAVPSWEQVNAIVEKYGISIDGVGQQLQQLSVTDAATKIINDFDTLIRAGGDVNGVLVGMQEEISEIVQRSIRFGTSIPENMRPLVEQLAKSGLLLGENKEKITDLSGLKWGAPVETEADKITTAIGGLVTKLDELITKLAGLTSVSAGVATEVGKQWAREPWADWKMPKFPAGEGGSEPIPGHAAGGVFNRPHRAWIAEGGQPEIVGSVTFIERALVGALRRVQGMATNAGTVGGRTVIENRIYLDGRELSGAMARWLPDVLAAQGVR